MGEGSVVISGFSPTIHPGAAMSDKKGKHTSLDKELRRGVEWLEKQPEIKRVILGLCEAARTKFPTGYFRYQRDIVGGQGGDASGPGRVPQEEDAVAGRADFVGENGPAGTGGVVPAGGRVHRGEADVFVVAICG